MASRFAKVARPKLVAEGAKLRLRPRSIRWLELGLMTAVGVASGTYIFRDSFMQINRNSQAQAELPLKEFLEGIEPKLTPAAADAAAEASAARGTFFSGKGGDA
jgi:hypothetical protein